MRPDDLLDGPKVPPSEVEWEDLLVRMELMPRALRVILDEVGPAADVASSLRELVDREAEAARFLEHAAAAADGISLEQPQLVTVQDDPRDMFERLRRRNFAIVQRRGIDVWGWSAELSPGRSATVYQLLSSLAASDVDTLARLRSARAEAAAAC